MRWGVKRVVIPNEIWQRLAKDDGLFKAAAALVKCCEEGQPPPRIYKPSGIAKDGSVFQPYLRLVLYHHHLHRSGDPLLVTQHTGETAFGIALARHSDHFGDEMLWLKEHASVIDWDLCEDIRDQVLKYVPEK